MVCHVPYIHMPCMLGPKMNLNAVAPFSLLLNGVSWSFKVNWRTQLDRHFSVQQFDLLLSCEKLQEYIL